MICPAVTSVSLLARAISFPALIAATVGLIPSIPTIAVTTISASLCVATATRPSIPDNTSILRSAILSLRALALSSLPQDTRLGLNFLICFSNKSILEPQDIATTSRSFFSSTIESVCVPIEPVVPRIAIFLILFLLCKIE